MKKILLLLMLLVAANIFLARTFNNKSGIATNGDSLKTIEPKDYLQNEDQLITSLLSRYHYKKFKLNDSLSSVIFNRYISSLDFNRSYFLASDISNFDKYKYMLDNDLIDGDLQPAYYIFNVFKKRVDERVNYVKELLNHKFDFTKKEFLEIKRDSAAWAKDTTELNDIWRKKVKNDALNLILTGKKWDAVVDILKKRYNNYRKAIFQYNSEDIFQTYMNAFTKSIDPHTLYLSPSATENFNIEMSRSLEGIGAQLQTEDDYTKVAEIIPGGPAYKSKQLHRNDKIVGVAQGNDGEMVDIIGWRLTDVVQLIRGPKKTIVRLLIIPANSGLNATPKEIKLVRDKIKLEEQSAKKSILMINENNKLYKLGVISIPAFYSDFAAEQKGVKNFKSTTRDVRILLDSLKQDKVDGIIIDLRNNGGGSLTEAIKLTGLFITDGPVVQVKNSSGAIDVQKDPDSNIVYSGPLAVLVNRFSASASEIFSGAIQDYDRGIIIGEQTFGKGTVQNAIDLNRLLSNKNTKFGQVNLTIAKFYRINGGSTQNLGVIPDIIFPSAFDAKEYGESAEPSALPWDHIKPTQYHTYGDVKKFLSALKIKHDLRVKHDPEFQALIDEVKDYKKSHETKYVSLNEAVRKKEYEEEEQKRFERENERRKIHGLKLLKKGEIPPEEDPVKDDPQLNEAGKILADLIALS